MQSNKNIIPIVFISCGALLLYALHQPLAGYCSLMVGLGIAALRNRELLIDLTLITLGLIVVSLVPITTDISYSHMFFMASTMTVAVLAPYLIDRYILKRSLITFPFGFREPWDTFKKIYLVIVLIIGLALLPWYIISTGMYVNWPAATDFSSVFRLFLGTNALGIWDELFFILTIFALFWRHVSFWPANFLQAIIFTSFLYELGFRGVGPYFIFLFALTQGYIFKRTHSLFYLLCIHLLFDLILFLVLIHAHNRDVLQIFIY